MYRGKKKQPVIEPTAQPSTPPDDSGYLKLYMDALEDGVDIEKRIVTIEGDVEEGWFTFIDHAFNLLEMLNEEAPITLRLQSGGGVEWDGWAVIGRMERSPCDIITEGYGCIMSMATIILAAGDTRRLSKHGTWMYHTAAYGAEGRHPQMRGRVRHEEREEVRCAKFMAERSKKPWKFWKNLGKNVDAYRQPEEVLALGIVDELF